MTLELWQESPLVVAAQRRTLRLLSAAQIAGGIGFGAGLSVGILLAQEVTQSEGWAGLARTSSTIGAALFAIPMAMLAMRLGRRPSLGGGWLMSAFGSMLLVGAAQLVSGPLAIALLVTGMTASGAGSATNLQTRYAAADLAAPAHRSRQLSLVVWATTVGAVLGPNLGAPGEAAARLWGLQPMAGPFVIATVMQLIAAALIMLLRPDPLLLAASHESAHTAGTRRPGLRTSLRLAWSIGPARMALVSICAAHSVMVGVMTMTPVHMDHHGAGIELVGLTISLHVLGMFALSPVAGWAADRFGRVPVIALGGVVLLAATAVAGSAGARSWQVMLGLFLLGLGWSLVLVSASTLLTESVPAADRTTVQGAADAGMNVAAAIGAAASGPLLGVVGFGGLNALSAAIVLAAAPIALRSIRATITR